MASLAVVRFMDACFYAFVSYDSCGEIYAVVSCIWAGVALYRL